MAQVLIQMYQLEQRRPGDWIHLLQWLTDRKQVQGMAPLLRFWGLIEQREGVAADGNPNIGFYRITDLGRQFVLEQVTVPRYIFLYNNTLMAVDASQSPSKMRSRRSSITTR